MRPSRGMGAISPDKEPKAKKGVRKDGATFETFAKGGSTPAWTRKEGKSDAGGLNAIGRAHV